MIAHPPVQAVPAGSKPGVALQDSPRTWSAEELQFRIFAILWAIASLFHMAHSSVFDTQLNFALLTLAALFVILRPSMTGFVVLIALQLFDALFRMPFTTNHWIFTAFVNLSILQVLLYLVIRNKTFQVNEGTLFKTFAPIVKIELIILYFFAVFHKLNSGFFSPATSCATDLLKAQNIDNILPLTAGIFTLNAYFTLIVELSIPLFLCFQRTRKGAVLVGLFFHCILSYSTYNAFYDFSSMVFAVYFLFISPTFSTTLYQWLTSVRSYKRAFLKSFVFSRLMFIVFAFLSAVVVIYMLNKSMDTFRTVHLYFFWTLYSILFTGLFLKFIISKKEVAAVPDGGFRLAHWSFVVLPIIVFINGTFPYLGLKTENSYAMFSNLRTEGGKTNHYIIPSGTQIFDYQKNVVQIVSSSDKGLQKLAEEKKSLVLFEFQNYVHERRPVKVEYLLNGKRRVLDIKQKASLEDLGTNPYVLKKLMKFRPFTIEEPQPCAH